MFAWAASTPSSLPRLDSGLSLAVQYQLHGGDPFWFRFVNLLLHGLNSAAVFVLFLLFWRFFPDPPDIEPRWKILGSFLAALLFAVHPVQSETSLYIYQRSTLLAAGFAFASLIAYLKGKTVWCLAAFSLAVLSKETAVVLPAVYWFTDGVFKKDWRPSKTALTAAGVSLCLALGIFLHWGVQKEETVGFQAGDWFTYIATQTVVFWKYLSLALTGGPLNLDWDIPPVEGLEEPAFLLAAGALLLLGLALIAFRRTLALCYWFGIFLLFLLPTSSLIPSQDFMAEHRLYTPMLGWCGLLLSAGIYLLELVPSRSRRRLMIPVAVLLLGAGSYLARQTENRIGQWMTPQALWRDAALKSPSKYRPHLNLGILLADREPEEAKRYLARAISLNPALPHAYRSLGEIHFVSGDLDKAEDLWKEALEAEPLSAETHLALGKLYLRKRDYFAAQRHLSAAREIAPRDPTPYWYRAQLNLQFGFTGQAIAFCEEGLARDEAHMPLRWLLADCMVQTENWDRAVELAEENLEFRSTSEDYYRLARILSRAGRFDRALTAVKEGLFRSQSPEQALRGKTLLSRLDRSPATAPLID